MNKISIDFSSTKYTDLELVACSREVVLKMTNNPAFTEPEPALTEIIEGADQLEEAITKVAEGTKADTEFKNRCRKALEKLLKKLVAYVEEVANGDRLIMLSSGFVLCKSPSQVDELDVPEDVRLSVEKGKGTLLVTCDRVDHARFYELQYTEMPIGDGSKIATLTSTKGYFLISNLTSGKEYAVRVAGASSSPSRSWTNWLTSFVI